MSIYLGRFGSELDPISRSDFHDVAMHDVGFEAKCPVNSYRCKNLRSEDIEKIDKFIYLIGVLFF